MHFPSESNFAEFRLFNFSNTHQRLFILITMFISKSTISTEVLINVITPTRFQK